MQGSTGTDLSLAAAGLGAIAAPFTGGSSLALTASLGSTALGAAGAGLSAFGQSSGDKYQAEQDELAAQEGRVKATQTNAAMTRNINQTLGNIDAVRAAARTDPTSPTGAAVRGQTEATMTSDKNIKVDSIMAQSDQDEAAAAYMRSASSAALLSGAVGIGASVLKGVAGLPSLGGSPLGSGAVNTTAYSP